MRAQRKMKGGSIPFLPSPYLLLPSRDVVFLV